MFLLLRWTQTILMGMAVVLLMDWRGITPIAGVGSALILLSWIWVGGAVMGAWWAARPSAWK